MTMLYVKNVSYDVGNFRPQVNVTFEATTHQEAWALFDFFNALLGKQVDPYAVKQEHTKLADGHSQLKHVPQLTDTQTTETKGQHE